MNSEQAQQRREYQAAWYQQNRDRIRERRRVDFASDPAAHQAHLERQRQYQRAYYARNRERLREKDRADRAANAERRDRERAYRERNREKRSAHGRAYYAQHREEIKARRRAYYGEHRDGAMARDAMRLLSDEEYRATHRLGTLLRQALAFP